MNFSMESSGNIIWGISCFFVILFLLIYDGGYKKDIRIICGLFVTFLILQTILSVLSISISFVNSPILVYMRSAILSLSGNMYVIMSTILILSPFHKNKLMRIIIIYILPIIYITFLIILTFISPSMQQTVAFLYFIPCGLMAYITMIILYHWYNKEKFIFAVYVHSYINVQHTDIHKMANWSLLLKMAIFGMTVALLANFVYPILVIIGLIPHQKHGVVVVPIVDSLIFLPFVTPLIRSLDKVMEYTKYRIMQYQITDHSSNHNEQEPLRDIDL